MRFFATAASSMVALGVAGAVTRRGGIKLAHGLQQSAKGSGNYADASQRAIQSFRSIQKHLDDLQGLTRSYTDGDELQLVNKTGRRLRSSDSVVKTDGFSMRVDNPELGEWAMRDEIQQRMVRQARRLPYELPAFYLGQKAVINPMLGNNQDKKVNWANPIDVIGDFANESMKIIATAVMPFDAGVGAGKQAYRNFAMHVSRNPQESAGVDSLKYLLEQVGASSSDLLNKTVKMSHQSLGAFSGMMQEAQENALGFRDFVRMSSAQRAATESGKKSSAARRAHESTKDGGRVNQDLRRSALDSLPGPFKGMGSAVGTVRKKFNDIGQTYDDWQDVISGRKSIQSIKKSSQERYDSLRAFMEKGGGTFIEQYAKSTYNMGALDSMLPGNKVNPNFRQTPFYSTSKEQIYKGMLVDNLSQKTGLTHEEALRFVQKAERITPFSSKQDGIGFGQNLMKRIQFGSKPFHGEAADWWGDIVDSANAHNIPLTKGSLPTGQSGFVSAIKSTDMQFSSSAFQSHMDRSIAKQWSHLAGSVIPKEASSGLKVMAQPYENFLGGSLDANKEFLIRRAAQRLDIDTLTPTGGALPLSTINESLRRKGLEPTNLAQLRGFLVDQKDISSPWSKGGANLFGFRPLSVGQAVDQGFFSANEAGVQEQIKRFVDYKSAMSVQSQSGILNTNAWRLKVGGAYTSSNGDVIDFGRMGRGIRGFLDAMANETKIPIVGFNPAQIMGHGAFQAQSRSPSLRLISPQSVQPFLTPGSKIDDDLLLWMKQRGRGSKGKVVGVSTTGMDAVSHRSYEGSFRAFMTTSESMVGRYGRVMVGDKGIPSSASHTGELKIPGSEKPSKLTGFKRAFDVSHDQDGSVFFGQQSLIRRFWQGRAGSQDTKKLRNAQRAAAQLADDSFDPKTMGPDMSEGVNSLLGVLRNFGFSNKLLKQISSDPKFKHIYDPLKGQNLFDVPESILPRVVKEIIKSDESLFAALPSEKRAGAYKMQQQLKNLLRQGDDQKDFWLLQTSDSAKTTGVTRRIEQLRNEVSDYLIGTSGLRGEISGDLTESSVEGTIAKLFSKVDELFSSGMMTKSEKSEARAAILSIHADNARNKAYSSFNADVNLLALNRKTAEAMMEGPSQIREVLNEVAQHIPGSKPGVRGTIGRSMRRNFTAVPYRKEFEVNPIGDNTLLVPTFGTVVERSGMRKAIKGVTTTWKGQPQGKAPGMWSDAEAISGSTMIPTHLTVRLNRYMETFGVGLDETRYSGPLDFYSRGLIGRRVLPAFAAGASFLAADRTLGGLVNRDDQGDPIYSPLLLGKAADAIVETQIGLAGAIPGGRTAEQARDELIDGEVPIRQGRYWILGSNPYKGGRVQYFRPSWYQRLKAGGPYTPEMNETPMERLMYGYDFSPLRPIDPYRREREDYQTRPYPVTGEYFTGPWGPLNPVLNASVGKVLKPSKQMHQEATALGLSQYAPVGESGAYLAGGTNVSPSSLAVNQQLSQVNQGYMTSRPGASSSSVMYPAMGYAQPRGYASMHVRERATSIAQMYESKAADPASYVTVNEMLVPYGVPVSAGAMSPRVIHSGQVMNPGSFNYLGRELGFRTQEMAGIYGFGASTIREAFGLGSQDLTPDRAILEPASRGYSAGRAFWNLNLGGTGDVPLPIESRYSNFEISEIVRRFVPKDQAGITYINDIPNQMGIMYPWLPGADYPQASIKSGDPYSAIPDAEIRLPGTGYARTNQLFPDEYGQIGLVNIHDILGSVAPWSKEYEAVDRMVTGQSPLAQAKITQTRAQVEAMAMRHEFTPYEYKYKDASEMAMNPTDFVIGRAKEWATHRDTPINTKFMPTRTALEDWERDNVYGATFPTWGTPIDSYMKPFLNKSTQRDPISASLAGGTFGMLFGATARAKAVGSFVGGATGAISSGFGSAYEKITGERYMPSDRRKEVALEEYMDILKYTKSVVNAQRAAQLGDMEMAQGFVQESRQTMYGADLNSMPEQVAMALPKRKREHFKAMLYAPDQEKEQILSTAGRLERRLYQAAWGMQVEARPNIVEYFEDKELPPADSEFWSPLTDTDNVKIKVGQSLGLDMAQMGYYPQQIKEANLINPSYPDIFGGQPSSSVAAQLRALLRQSNVNGNIRAIPNMFGSDRVELIAGVY